MLRVLLRRSMAPSPRAPIAAPIAVIVPLLVAACMVGPDYERPEAAVPEAWSDSKGQASPAVDAAWWRQFHDPALEELIASAVAQNLTLRQAGLRVLQARALRGLAAGQFFPQVQAATAELSTQRNSRSTPLGAVDNTYDTAAVGLQAVWELDFWGKFRRGIESADAALEASVADYDAFLVALAADVATDYVALRSLQEQLAFTRSNVQAQQDTLALTEVRMRAGAVSELDVATARATLANTQALVPELEDALRQRELALAVLLGRTPQALAAGLQGAQVVPAPPATIALGVPADLLRRRPDVRAAERNAAAFSGQIGATKAELYPSITLTGTTGFRTTTFQGANRSPGLNNLFDADSFEGFLGLAIQWPLLDYGRIENRVRAADARFEEAAVAYQNAVLGAAAEVEGGLSRFLKSREQAALLEQSVRAAQRTVELSLLQYRQGAADFLRVNQAQVDLVERQNRLVLAREQTAQGAIATYRALGGGWEDRSGEYVPRATIERMRARTDWGDVLSPDRADGQQPESEHQQ
jgi:NodT family efflux transporter outer membrane factor (OMF) lipoprotein